MGQEFWTYAWVIVTFGVYIGIALWARAGSTDDFYVAGHDVHPMVNDMATAAGKNDAELAATLLQLGS